MNQKLKLPHFDYTILKSNVGYSRRTYEQVKVVYQEYLKNMDDFQRISRTEKMEQDFMSIKRKMFADTFRAECERICSNEDELCDIVVDMCYQTEKSKQFAWDICGEVMLNNLAKLNNNKIKYPELVESDGEFDFCGKQFVMKTREYEPYNENQEIKQVVMTDDYSE